MDMPRILLADAARHKVLEHLPHEQHIVAHEGFTMAGVCSQTFTRNGVLLGNLRV